ncbi:MAG: tetraacyldisaccharide 4'-kinase [Pseudomonadota bacterium]
MNRIEQIWNGWGLFTLLLLPLSALYCLLVAVRRRLYRLGLLNSGKLPAPVIVVGNISVGGTGKTPVVVWLARWLLEKGFSPGIVTRGYGGESAHWPRQVTADTQASQVGDEAVLLYRRTSCPVYAGPDRFKTGQRLLAEQDCNIIISDDGLQHYALSRDLELAVIDGERRFGNGLCLPAGPLREQKSRLHKVDLILTNGTAQEGEQPFQVSGTQVLAVNDSGGEPQPLSSFAGKHVEAVAGIGNPERFFSMLESIGVKISRHVFPDHHPFSPNDLASFAGNTVLMTEKDAVKCEAFAANDVWFVPADAHFNENFTNQLELSIDRLIHG